jgi:hypothetical protein
MLFGTNAPADSFSGFQSVKTATTRLCFPYLDESTREGGFTGIALVNPGVETFDVSLRLIDKNGRFKQGAVKTLSGNQKLVTLINDLFSTGIEAGDTVLARASQPIVAFELYGQGNRTMGGILAVAY